MIRISIILVGSALLVGALAEAAQDKPATDRSASKEAAEPYDGFKADQALLRKHLVIKYQDGRKDITTSSGEAISAAQRIFSRVSFLFRSREEVLELLGDPATISEYGKPQGKDPSSPLVYVFDTGWGGLDIHDHFQPANRQGGSSSRRPTELNAEPLLPGCRQACEASEMTTASNRQRYDLVQVTVKTGGRGSHENVVVRGPARRSRRTGSCNTAKAP